MDKLPQSKAAAAIKIQEFDAFAKKSRFPLYADPCPKSPHARQPFWTQAIGIRFTGGLKLWNPKIEYQWRDAYHGDLELWVRCTIFVPYCEAYKPEKGIRPGEIVPIVREAPIHSWCWHRMTSEDRVNLLFAAAIMPLIRHEIGESVMFGDRLLHPPGHDPE